MGVMSVKYKDWRKGQSKKDVGVENFFLTCRRFNTFINPSFQMTLQGRDFMQGFPLPVQPMPLAFEEILNHSELWALQDAVTWAKVR